MSGTSLAPGFLQPVTTMPDADDGALDGLIQAWIVGLTGLPGSLVRPRWQPAPPPSPDQDVDWCAVGVLGSPGDPYSFIGHNADGTSTLHRHEMLEAMATFYGPRSGHYARVARDGALIGQNRDALSAADVQLTEVGSANTFAELVNQIWRGRTDMPFTLRRQVSRIYPIRSLVDAPLWVRNDFDAEPSLYPTLLDDPVRFRRLVARGDAAANATAALALSRRYAASATSDAGVVLAGLFQQYAGTAASDAAASLT